MKVHNTYEFVDGKLIVKKLRKNVMNILPFNVDRYTELYF